MKITTEKLPKSQIKIKIELDKNDEKKFRAAAIAKISKNAKIPGFRAGHIPEKVIVEKYGEETIRSEMIEIAAPKAVSDAIISEKLMPIVRPEIAVEKLDPLTFSATITVLPEIKLDEKYKSVKIPEKKPKIGKKEIDAVLESLRERHIERVPVDRPAQKGDFVEIDFEGKTPDGVPLDGTASKMHPVVIGSNQFIPGFENELLGLKTGDEKTFEILFPKDYGAKHLAGKPVVFSVKVHGVFDQKKPKIDDKLATEILGKKATAADLKAEIQKMLEEKAAADERTRRENELLEKWTALATADLPDILIDEELENMIRMMKMQILQNGLSWENHLQNLKTTEKDFREKLRPDAEKRALQRLLIGKILAGGDFEVSDAEIEAALHGGHAPAEKHHHDKSSDAWKQAVHRARVQKLFDHFLAEKKEKSAKKEK